MQGFTIRVQFSFWYQQEQKLTHLLELVADCEVLGSFLGGETHGIYGLTHFCLELSVHSPKGVYQKPLLVYFKQQRFTLLVPEVPVTSPRVSDWYLHTSKPLLWREGLWACSSTEGFEATCCIQSSNKDLSLPKENKGKKKKTIIGRNGVDFS